ncbi:MAG TPA: lytic transglycosylase domain-containing protein [Streptosporangiaceae bacterium]|nr:lytic transglycosylase domain-containing protein [Streptosporangiaceae bacterium]
MLGRRGGTAALGLTAALLVLTGALLLPGPVTPRLAPRALVSGLAAIPPRYLNWYARAARTCTGLTWEVLAGIGTVESDNGRSRARGVHHGNNRKGAEGPMQFEPATFREYAVRADRSAKLTPYNPQDAIFSAARMLCADGARGGTRRGVRGAIFAYNHAHWYVRDVLALAARYTAAARALCPPALHRVHLGHWSGHRRPHWHRPSRRHRGRRHGICWWISSPP